MTERLVIASSSEIVLKSPMVRRFMENQLRRQIKDSLERKGVRHGRIIKGGGRTYVYSSDPEKALQVILRIPGIDFASIAICTEADISPICNSTIDCLATSLNLGESFAVRAKVIENEALSKREVEIKVGQAVLDRLADKVPRVNLDRPDKTAYIEIRGSDAFIYCDPMNGPRGLPVGTQGKMLGVFSDIGLSTVASWMMLRRGALIVPVCVEAWRGPSSGSLEAIVHSLAGFREWVPVRRLLAFILRTEELAGKINEMTTESVSNQVYLGSILRASDIIAAQEGALGIVVADRMILNRAIISSCRTPVYQPLIGLTERELVKYFSVLGISPRRVHEPHDLVAEAPGRIPELAALLDDEDLQHGIMSLAEKRETLML